MANNFGGALEFRQFYDYNYDFNCFQMKIIEIKYNGGRFEMKLVAFRRFNRITVD